ncbi:ferritin-like fold-containing protein [Gordonia liuliyuniae]|uniref:Ferritin-like domain-containing protein n=1 Tax=Gordonia liuliyuniae TaxID=2911517 RepID=A0ABS9ING4_9ACTN|nr:ferritin-like fold-containing protein [Gordonia liuliyuniae]MCF8587094.1 ferritin-like domain-containing protein [Gordonia liuliyuniae]
MPNTSNATAKLYGLLLAGEFAACYRLIDESTMAPTTADRVAIARLIAAEMAHFEELATQVSGVGGDPEAAVSAHAKVFDDYHRVTTPSSWLEALVKMYIGDGLAADFYTELADRMSSDVQPVVASVLGSTGSSQFAVDRVRAAIAADPSSRSALALWGRRLLGEAITHMQWVLAEEDEVMDLLFTGDATLATAASFFDGIAERHAQRMADLGLA